jgi:hypothetical protein
VQHDSALAALQQFALDLEAATETSRLAPAWANAGGVTPLAAAHANFSASFKQQQLRQQ